MKAILSLIVGLSLLSACNSGYCKGDMDNKTTVQPLVTGEGDLKIMSSPELFGLTAKWASEYEKLHPSLKVTVTNIADVRSISSNDLSFVSDENENNADWKMVIGRDVAVPVINAKNPLLNVILDQGIPTAMFTRFFADPSKRNWANLIKGGQNAPIKFYLSDNKQVIGKILDFTKTDASSLGGIKLATASEVIAAVQKDVYAIGFCKLTDVMGYNSNELIASLKILPIDKNGNGRIDNFENIYKNMGSFTRGVWIGKYPNALCGSIYVSSPVKPADKNTLDFLAWTMSDGRQYLSANGYGDLSSSKIQANFASLGYPTINTPQPNTDPVSHPWLAFLVVLMIAVIIVPIMVGKAKREKPIVVESEEQIAQGFNENTVLAPNGLYFDKTHTWAIMEKDGNVRVGIDDFLQHVTGTITRVIMKNPSEKVRRGENVLTIVRDGKQLDIKAPISGIIKRQNRSLIGGPWLVNSSPYSEGWVYMIEPMNWAREIQFMFIGEKYKTWLKDEFSRLKDFVARSFRINTVSYSYAILQDGGELTDNFLADLGPEVWEDFQTQFIDPSK